MAFCGKRVFAGDHGGTIVVVPSSVWDVWTQTCTHKDCQSQQTWELWGGLGEPSQGSPPSLAGRKQPCPHLTLDLTQMAGCCAGLQEGPEDSRP